MLAGSESTRRRDDELLTASDGLLGSADNLEVTADAYRRVIFCFQLPVAGQAFEVASKFLDQFRRLRSSGATDLDKGPCPARQRDNSEPTARELFDGRFVLRQPGAGGASLPNNHVRWRVASCLTSLNLNRL